MALSGTYGPVDDKQGIATIHAALDAGIDLLDTGDFYGIGHNELLIARSLQRREHGSPLISVKFGALRGPDGAFIGQNTSPAAVKSALAYSLTRLGADHVDVYRPARLDPNVPIEETIGAIAEMVQAGYVRHIGLSEVGAETIRRAAAVHPITDLQIEYSLLSRGIEQEILPTCRELGIAITAYGVLCRGLLSGHYSPGASGNPRDIRAAFPRFQGENLERNIALVRQLSEFADGLETTISKLAFAWVLSRGDDIIPLAGGRTPEQITDAVAALELELSASDLARIEAAIPPDAAAGERYGGPQMAHLDSER
jgi:aryl-alcohol dehydrogenase-like predicted oxidoreductase